MTASARLPERTLGEDADESAAGSRATVALADADVSTAEAEGLPDELEEAESEAVVDSEADRDGGTEAEPERDCDRDTVRESVGERDWDLERVFEELSV